MKPFSWVRSTGQMWKLGVVGGGVLSGILLLAELATGGELIGGGEAMLIASAFGGLLAGLGGLWLIRCPACKSRVAWHVVRTADASVWLVKLVALQRCPRCGYGESDE